MKRNTITISFKKTTKDMKLFTLLSSFEEKSDTIKEILYKVLIEDNEKKNDV